MILGSKPLSELTEAELLAGIEELRASREALRADAQKRRAAGVANGTIPADGDLPRERAKRTPKAKEKSASQMMAEWLAKGGDDD